MGTPIAVVGPGAIGSTMAALLHAAGHSVLLCGHTPRDHVEVRPDDPVLTGSSRSPGQIIVPGPVHTDPAGVDGPVDVVLLAVKDTQNQSASGWLARLCDDRTVVCALQNGVEQVDRVGPLCPSSEVVPAVVWFSAEPHAEGWFRLRTGVRLVLPQTGGAQKLADLLRDTGVEVELESDFISAAWRKLLVNAVADLMVLTGRRSGMFRRDDVAALARRYLAECLAVARAEGADLGDDIVEEIVGMFAKAPEDMTTSMLTDREARRRLEWDVRNGVIPRKADKHGIATPISDLLVPLLAAASDGPG